MARYSPSFYEEVKVLFVSGPLKKPFVNQKNLMVSDFNVTMVGHEEEDNPIKHMDELKRPRVHYAALVISNEEDSIEMSGAMLLASNSDISICLVKQADQSRIMKLIS